MKKLICLVLAALLCVGAVAMAETSVPSKTTGDMATATGVKTESGAASNVTIALGAGSAEAQKAAEDEVAKLAASKSADDYFGVSVSSLLGTENVNVHEFMSFSVDNYDEAEGAVTANFCLSTPYKANERVVVMVGVRNAKGEIEWIPVEGVGTGVNGEIAVTFPAEVLAAIQASGADPMMAVVSA